MTESDNNQNNPQGGQGVNPAWNEFFEAIPEDFRDQVQPAVMPVLEKWDQGVQKRFEAYKPFERYVKEGIDPEVLDYSMNLFNTLNTNEGAIQVFEQLGQYLEKEGLLGQEEDEEDAEEEFDWKALPAPLRKQIEQLQGGFSTLAEYQIAQEQQKREAEEDALLEAELKSLKDKYGDYDEDWVLAKMVNGMDAEEAVQAYHQWLDKTLQERNRPTGFKPMGSGSGGFPSGNANFDPKKASNREVTDMITAMLMDHKRNLQTHTFGVNNGCWPSYYDSSRQHS